jgi:hypothetical protein
MDLSASVLGKAVVDYLHRTQDKPVLTIGRDKFSRGQLSLVACFNFTAAANLSNILNRELQVKDTRDVFEHIHPDRLALPRLGAVSLAVLGAAFESKGLGGNAPLTNWFKRHAIAPVTFHTLKARESAEVATEKKATKARRRARRNTAHEIRVNRFEQRNTANV